MWLLDDVPFEDPTDYYGFVYMIHNQQTGRKYIGRKYFTKSKQKQVKGKKKRIRASSDWQDYWGSNAELKQDIEQNGVENFKRIILRLCKTRSECNYYETKYIFDHDALLKAEFYNSWVSAKIRADHLKHLQQH